MKTAMQLLKQDILNLRNEAHINGINEFKNAMNQALNKIENYITNERQQIIDAGNNVNEYYHAKKMPNGFDIGLDYFEKTFEN